MAKQQETKEVIEPLKPFIEDHDSTSGCVKVKGQPFEKVKVSVGDELKEIELDEKGDGLTYFKPSQKDFIIKLL